MNDFSEEAMKKFKRLEELLGYMIDLTLHPFVDNMSLEDMKDYRNDIRDELNDLDDLYDDEPLEETSYDYECWKFGYNHLEKLLDELENHISCLSDDWLLD